MLEEEEDPGATGAASEQLTAATCWCGTPLLILFLARAPGLPFHETPYYSHSQNKYFVIPDAPTH